MLGDIHGRQDALEATLTWLATHYEDARLVSLGNRIGHGPDSLTITKTLLDSPFDPILLPGSQEIMLAHAIQNPSQSYDLWLMNGGHAIVDALNIKNTPETVLQALKTTLSPSFQTDTLHGPSHHWDGDCLFVHAGISPHLPLASFLNQPATLGTPLNCHWAWIKDPFLTWKSGWGQDKNTTIFHGHTPAITYAFESYKDISELIKPTHHRVNLNAGSEFLSQIAWAELQDGFFRVGLCHIANGDIF